MALGDSGGGGERGEPMLAAASPRCARGVSRCYASAAASLAMLAAVGLRARLRAGLQWVVMLVSMRAGNF